MATNTQQDGQNERVTAPGVGRARSPQASHRQLLLFLLSRSVVSGSLRARGRQHPGLPCPSPSPRVCSDSRPGSGRCHPEDEMVGWHRSQLGRVQISPSLWTTVQQFPYEANQAPTTIQSFSSKEFIYLGELRAEGHMRSCT